MGKTLMIGLLMSGILLAQDTPRHDKLWLTSIAAMTAGSAADAASSWGLPESNPALRGPNGRFGAHGVGLKVGVAGGLILFEALTRRDARMRRMGTVVNFGAAGLYGATAVHNVGLR